MALPAEYPPLAGRDGGTLPCVLALAVMAMLHGKTKLAGITAWIRHAGQEDLAAAGACAGRDGRLAAPSPKTVTGLPGLVGAQVCGTKTVTTCR